MTTYQPEDRSYAGYTYPRPTGSSHGDGPSPERLHSSHGYVKGAPDQQPPQSYPPQPITPLSGNSYPPQPPPSQGYYGISQAPPDQQHVPSPPPSSNGRPDSQNFTSEGAPIVPVGISGGKMFRCRGYGDCDKVFTRSEHLARHVRKHTGERPFPCHCGKAFSRLDNLRQHAATVHADQASLNDAMLNSLAPVHAALSQRANRDQRKRGEVVEVPKNAVERPRHNEQYRGHKPMGPDGYYPPEGFQQGRPRTGGGYDYPPYVEGQPGDAGPSRRPSSGYPGYPPVYYDQARAPPPPPGGQQPEGVSSQLPYPYRPMSSNGRELPVPAHYADSDPPNSAHGPPQSPMYPPGPVPPAPQWSSPPGQPHSAYPQGGHYQQQEGYSYPPPPPPPEHGQYPPGTNYNYPPAPYYPQQSYSSVPPPPGPYPPPPGSYAAPHNGQAPPPPDSQFQYHQSQAQQQHEGYPYGQYDARKRRAEEADDSARKVPRSGPPEHAAHHGQPQHVPSDPNRGQEPLWLPPTTERRSSLAISALLGSPQQAPRSRPSTADVGHHHQQPAYSAAPASSGGFYNGSGASGVNGAMKKEDAKKESGVEMDQKAKALLSQGS